MITLLEKKGKDRPLIKNWRPISLINVDVKIASKAIARRLERILPDLIHPIKMASLRKDQYKTVFGRLKIYLNLLSLPIVQVFSWQLTLRKHSTFQSGVGLDRMISCHLYYSFKLLKYLPAKFEKIMNQGYIS